MVVAGAKVRVYMAKKSKKKEFLFENSCNLYEYFRRLKSDPLSHLHCHRKLYKPKLANTICEAILACVTLVQVPNLPD